MGALFENTVSAICYDIARAHASNAVGNRPPFNDITAFVLAQWRRMPRFLAWPMWAVTLGFAVAAIVSDGGLHHWLTPERRANRLERWRLSRIGPCRDLVRFYQSLALLALYSREHGVAR